MATYTTYAAASIIITAGAGVDTGYLTPAPDGWMISGETDAAYTATAIVKSGRTIVADVGDGQQRNFLYDQIFITPSGQYAGYVSAPTVTVGAVTTDIQRTVTLWNAHDHTNVLSAVNYTQAGVTFSDGTALPDTLPALESVDYTLSVAADGEFTVDCDITYTFSVDDSPALTVSGYRATLYNYWAQTPVKETIQSLTWKFVSDDGSEQRMKLRDVPRRNYGVPSLLTPAQWREAQNRVRMRRAATWAVPLFHEATFQNSTYSGGTSTLSLDTSSAEYYAGGLVVVWKSSTEFWLSQAETVSASSITLADPLDATLSGDLRIAPCMTAKMTSFSSNVDPVGNRKISASFQIYDGDDLSGLAESVTLAGYDVLTHYCEGNAVADGMEIEIWDVDYDIGGAKWGTVWQRPKQSRQYKVTLTGMDEIWAFRRFVHSHTNRDPFWISTNESDFQLSASITAAANSVRVYDNGLFDNSTGRTGICLMYADGTTDYRGISSFAEYDADETTINLSAATSNGTTQTAADTKASALWLVVLDSDVTFTHYGHYSEATFTVSEVYA